MAAPPMAVKPRVRFPLAVRGRFERAGVTTSQPNAGAASAAATGLKGGLVGEARRGWIARGSGRSRHPNRRPRNCADTDPRDVADERWPGAEGAPGDAAEATDADLMRSSAGEAALKRRDALRPGF